MKKEYRMSFARLWMSWERPMPTATVDTKWRQIPWNGLHRGQSLNMYPKIGTSFGTLMVLDGALANKNTSHPEAIGIEVWTNAQLSKKLFFQPIFILINSRWSGYIRTLARSLERWSPRGVCRTSGASPTKWRSKKEDPKEDFNRLETHTWLFCPLFHIFWLFIGHSSSILDVILFLENRLADFHWAKRIQRYFLVKNRFACLPKERYFFHLWSTNDFRSNQLSLVRIRWMESLLGKLRIRNAAKETDGATKTTERRHRMPRRCSGKSALLPTIMSR